jgi:hypothetical protein
VTKFAWSTNTLSPGGPLAVTGALAHSSRAVVGGEGGAVDAGAPGRTVVDEREAAAPWLDPPPEHDAAASEATIASTMHRARAPVTRRVRAV